MRASFTFRHTPIALCALMALGALPAQAQVTANTLPVVRPGGAVINATVGTPAGNTLAITQTPSAGNRGLIEWSSFSIGSAARVNITQPNAQSLLVNRVVGAGNGPSASEIHGSLSANGRVMLINPAGVMFGASAQVSAGSLVASALDLAPGMTADNYASLVGGADIALSGGAGPVWVDAANAQDRPQIQVSEGGSIVLISQSEVSTSGVMAAPRGEINMSTASEALLRPVGTSGYVQVLATTPAEAGSSQLSTGHGSQTTAAGGRIVIGGQPGAVASGRADSISLYGELSTDGGTGNGGSIHADAGAGGTLWISDARISASSAGGRGGSVTLRGDQIRLERGEANEGPEVLAEGATGGGEIRIGGNATRALLVSDTVLLSADATRHGDGGLVSLHAMYHDASSPYQTPRYDFGVTEVYGTVRARGGADGGNGGQIETSGMAVTTALANSGGVYRRGTVDARARAAGGSAGTWTLDPFDVTISNDAPQDVAGSFEPIGPGANVQASDIEAALNAGTSVVISTDAGGAGTQAGHITVAPDTVIAPTAVSGNPTLTLRANHNILIEAATIAAAGTGSLNVHLHADSDGNGSGGITLLDTTLRTNGGSVVASGGLDPATGHARGDASSSAVAVLNSTIDTRNTQTETAGDVTLRGRGATVPGAPAAVTIDDSTLRVGALTIDGRSSHGTAVLLNGLYAETTAGGADIRGIATRTDSSTADLIGIDVSAVLYSRTGTVTLAGRGDDAGLASSGATGLRIDDLAIGMGGDTRGRIQLVGQSTGGSTAAGLQMAGPSSRVIVDGGDGGTAHADLVVGALSDLRENSLELGVAGAAPSIRITGTANFRPLGVDGATGAIVEQTAVPISIIPTGSNLGAGTYTVQSSLLGGEGAIVAGEGKVVGSSAHVGAIAVDSAAFTSTMGTRLTLQNEGGGSQGIHLGAGNHFDTLGLLSTGNVTQGGGGIDALELVVRGGPTSSVTLDTTSNQIGVLAFEALGALTVLSGGTLTVDAASAPAYDAAADRYAPIALTSSTGGNTALLRATGDVAIQQPIGMNGEVPQLDIVSASSVSFGAGAALSVPGGQWRVWAPSVVDAGTAGAYRNLYGCIYGDIGTCSVSGIALPTSGNLVLHATRPTITVTATPTTGVVGAPLPPLGYSVSGLVNGDTPAVALSGTLEATPSGPGTYTIGQGTLASPLGYDVVFNPSVLTLRRAELTRHMLMDAFHAENSSDVYGRNLDRPFVCTAASVALGALSGAAASDPLASEWGKVRHQPQLSGCLNVSDAGSCSAF